MKPENMKEIAKNFRKLSESVFSAVMPENPMIQIGRTTKEVLLGIIEILDEKEKNGKQNTAQKKKSQKIDITG